jgi:hypothetical protein
MEDVQLNFVDAEPEDDAYLRTSRKEGRSSSQVLEERAERFNSDFRATDFAPFTECMI